MHPGHVTGLDAGDLDADGAAELVVTAVGWPYDTAISVLRVLSGQLVAVASLDGMAGAVALPGGDRIVVGSPPSILRLNAGSLEVSQTLPGPDLIDAVAGEVNADGDRDLVLVHEANDKDYFEAPTDVYLAQADGSFSLIATVNAGPGLAVTDVNGDDFGDLVVPSRDARLGIYPFQALGFAPLTQLFAHSPPSAAILAGHLRDGAVTDDVIMASRFESGGFFRVSWDCFQFL